MEGIDNFHLHTKTKTTKNNGFMKSLVNVLLVATYLLTSKFQQNMFREGLTRKKVSHLGGVRTKLCHFHTFLFFFFHVLNHANLQRKIFFSIGGGVPLYLKIPI